VLASEPGGPAATVEVVRKLVGEKGGKVPSKGEVEEAEKKEDEEMAETADEVADTAAKVDA
jgi:peroxiredoxin Q/BCP